MKRFIDLRGQIYNDDLPKDEQETCFAFYCTVKDHFETHSGTQQWENISDFKMDYHITVADDQSGLDRLLGLIPDWVPAE